MTTTYKGKCLICLTLCEVQEMCTEKHQFCIDCLNAHYKSMISSGKISNACIKCGNAFFKSKLLACLQSNIYEKAVNEVNLFEEFSIPNNLMLISCPLCPSGDKGKFLVDKNSYCQFFTCEKENCMKKICLYCLKECREEVSHHKCKKYLRILKCFEKVIQYAICVNCTKCLKTKQVTDYFPPTEKDTGCTHIGCNICKMTFCFVCGGHQEEVDWPYVIGGNPICLHNSDWKTNKKRCPGYIRNIAEIYTTWPQNEEKATEYFEKYKLLSYIKKVVNKFGLTEAKAAYDTFKDTKLALIPESVWGENFNQLKTFPQVDDKIFSIYDIN